MRQGLIIIFILFLGLIDLYFYQGVKTITASLSPSIQLIIAVFHGAFVGSTILIFLIYVWLKGGVRNHFIKYKLVPGCFIQYLTKLFCVLFLLLNDLARLAKWIAYKVAYMLHYTGVDMGIMPRSVMLTQVSMLAATVPITILGYGIISGAHDYRVRRVRIKLPNLPAAFHGLKIGQISDVHSGSFFNKTAVTGGLDMLLHERPDVIFFTGDLVNDTADEMTAYMSIFSKLQAKLGVYSTLGNHDYGDYVPWHSLAAKQENLKALCKIHELLGWKLLLNEHAMLTVGSDKIAILGVENWGVRFSKYGKLAQAYQGLTDIPVKLLLSHDPSHWNAEVRPKFGDIDVTFAGHTHGFQFGIEIGSFKWSPVQYQYKQWAGLYQEGSQYLYVNRGFGYIGYPGRIGILPELTIVELERSDR